MKFKISICLWTNLFWTAQKLPWNSEVLRKEIFIDREKEKNKKVLHVLNVVQTIGLFYNPLKCWFGYVFFIFLHALKGEVAQHPSIQPMCNVCIICTVRVDAAQNIHEQIQFVYCGVLSVASHTKCTMCVVWLEIMPKKVY